MPFCKHLRLEVYYYRFCFGFSLPLSFTIFPLFDWLISSSWIEPDWILYWSIYVCLYLAHSIASLLRWFFRFTHCASSSFLYCIPGHFFCMFWYFDIIKAPWYFLGFRGLLNFVHLYLHTFFISVSFSFLPWRHLLT